MSGTGSMPTAPNMGCIVRCLTPIPRISSSAAMATRSRLRCARVAFDLRRARNRRLQRRRRDDSSASVRKYQSGSAMASSVARSTIVITRLSIRMKPARCHSRRQLLTLSRLAPTRVAARNTKLLRAGQRSRYRLRQAPGIRPRGILAAGFRIDVASKYRKREPCTFHCVLAIWNPQKRPD